MDGSNQWFKVESVISLLTANKYRSLGGCHGLVVIGDDSCSKYRGFKSQHY